MDRAAGLLCLGVTLALLTACRPAPDEAGVVNVYSWPGYIAGDTLANFEKQYGVRVRYNVFDSNQILETKLLAGRSGYDVVVPSAAYVERLSRVGALRKLDRALLPNLANLDPDIVAAAHDRADTHGEYGVPYVWGTNGFMYDRAKIRARLPDAPVDSWAMLFDPRIVAHFADCGVVLFDTPIAVIPHVLAWLGRDPNSEDRRDLEAAIDALLAVRPYIRYLSNVRQFSALPNGDICLAIASSGDAWQAQQAARRAGTGIDIAYSVPREGAQVWFDMLAIPVDAPHVANAHLFINYLLDAHVAADIANATGLASPNAAARPYIAATLLDDPALYPSPAERERLFPDPMKSDAYLRERLRMWARFKAAHP
ncbi:MAG: Spermidine-binding periplasmic protein SpuE [Steroidobacteraceae bacterium]|nr:Spermidine-binding periplasmic protein SpuE [Steroidobacteraceae bacterium]